MTLAYAVKRFKLVPIILALLRLLSKGIDGTQNGSETLMLTSSIDERMSMLRKREA